MGLLVYRRVQYRHSIHGALLVLAAWLVGAPALHAQLIPDILEISPGFHQWVDSLSAPVTVRFKEEMPQISNRNFLVYGSQTGRYVGTVSYDADERLATFQHTDPFKVGEVITAILTSDIIGGTPGGFMWSFYPAPYRGDGVPADSVRILTGLPRPYSLAAGDFNGDGFLDLVSANMNSDRITLFAGDCVSLTPAATFPTNAGPTRLKAVDVNADGALDLIVAHFLGSRLTIHRNTGNGNLSNTITVDLFPLNPAEFEAVEFTGDALIDLIVAGINSVVLLENNGGGNFGPPQYLVEPDSDLGESPSLTLTNITTASGDVDNNGYVDLYVSFRDHSLVAKFSHGRNILGFRREPSGYISLPEKPIRVEVAELHSDGAGYLDLIVATEGNPDQHLLTYWNDDSGVIPPTLVQDLPVDFPADLDFFLANLDPETDGGRRDFDLLANHTASHELLFFRNGEGMLESPLPVPTGVDPQHFTGGDFNLDGAIDIAVPCSQDNAIWLFLSDNPQTWALSFDPERVDFGEFPLCDSDTVEIFIRNEELFPVDITAIELETGVVFRLLGSLPLRTINPGETLKIVVEYRPVAVGDDFDRVIVQSSRCNTITQYIELSGSGRALLEAEPASVIFPDTEVGATTGPRAITLQNTSLATVHSVRAYLMSTTTPSAFFISQCDSPVVLPDTVLTTIDPGGSFDVCVSFRPFDQISFADTLVVDPAPTQECRFDPLKIPLAGLGLLNDPPFFVNEPDSASMIFFEGEDIAIDLSAEDLDFDPLRMRFDTTLTSPYPLPEPSWSFLDVSPCSQAGETYEGCGEFRWTAPELPEELEFMVYRLYFTVREIDTPELYADTLRVPVTVRQLLPDLRIVDLSVTSSGGRNIVNRPVTVRSSITVDGRPLSLSPSSFRFRLRMDEGQEANFTVEEIREDEIMQFSTDFTFRNLGDHWIEAFVDVDDVVAETNEENNRIPFPIRIERGTLAVRHNPFTPNGDGFNDRVEFDMTELVPDDPRLFIFTLDGRKVVTISDREGPRMYWDGKDGDGRGQRPGAYLYVLKDGDSGLASGTIGLVR